MNFLGDFINGGFVKGPTDGQWEKLSPSDQNDKILSPVYSLSSVEKAYEAAQEAFAPWRDLGLEKRKEFIFNLQKVYQKREKEICDLIARETGKPLWEASTEAKALHSKITVTLEQSLNLVKEHPIENALPGGIRGVIRYQPRGVLGVLGPFNFPTHLPNGHIIPALLLGNTIIFKPSEKTPAVGQWFGEVFKEAHFPKGVFNMIQGPVEVGQKLSQHSHLDGVLFTGSYEVGLQIKKNTLYQYNKILALEMGGKNTALVWKDADLEKAIYENLMGAFITAGQRCSCTSKILIHRSVYEAFASRFSQAAKKIKVGHWKDNPFFGALIDHTAQERYLKFQDIAQREGAEALLKGQAIELSSYKGHYVTPSVHLVSKHNPDSVYQNTEFFSPNTALYPIDSFEEAIDMTNSSGFGLAMSIFTKDKKLYEETAMKAKVGLLNWNRATTGASSKLPFGGRGRSGNDRPSGDFAVYYCSSPVASLEDESTFKKESLKKQPPGLNYDF